MPHKHQPLSKMRMQILKVLHKQLFQASSNRMVMQIIKLVKECTHFQDKIVTCNTKLLYSQGLILMEYAIIKNHHTL